MVWHFTHPLDTVIEHLAVRLDGTKFSEVIQFGVYDWLETGWFKAILEHIRAASCWDEDNAWWKCVGFSLRNYGRLS